MTRGGGVSLKPYSLRKPAAEKPAAEIPEERRSNEVLGPNKLQKELLALKNANRMLEEQLQSTGKLDSLKLREELEEKDRDLAESKRLLEEASLNFQRSQRELETSTESVGNLRRQLVDEKKKS